MLREFEDKENLLSEMDEQVCEGTAHHRQQHCHCDHQQIVIVASISIVMIFAIIIINITT